ncbi:Nif11-like leader peptide family natural product precursor [Nostoc sp. LPT]|uniref:Nif11-like leader peptide family natural product precursor n=1 Tax=Nostoc sp. LPT TaxID=2815387 RepID=UPI001DDC6B30|nr:Nif11-like leader peptide family natural product precursor [Nostoc sp. LPT]MBN4003109.1 Nif11-like leader peptide family natural product precursor [Nostoc sp. LPT]
MTTNDLKQFYTKVLKDPMLQERLKATDPESLSELAVEQGKEKGYSFTKEEILRAMAIKAVIAGEYVELGEDEEVIIVDGADLDQLVFRRKIFEDIVGSVMMEILKQQQRKIEQIREKDKGK